MRNQPSAPRVPVLLACISLSVLTACAMPSSTTPPSATARAGAAFKPSFAVPNIPAPKIPDRTFNVRDFGAKGDGKTNDGPAINAAIQMCGKANGGRVLVPAGTYFTGPIDLVSNLDLHVDEGALLLFSQNKEDYPLGAFKSLPTRYRPLIAGDGLHDVLISGTGKFDGQGEPWWVAHRALGAKVKEKGYEDPRPKMLCLESCKRVRIENVTLMNAPMFHMSPTHCEDVVIDGVQVHAPAKAPNTDSCNPSGWNYVIRNCTFDVGDDNVAVKPFHKAEDGRLSVENLFIYDCTFKRGHGLSVGGQTPGGLRNMHVWNCTFEGTDNGIRLKSMRGDGGLVENVSFENITMKDVRSPIVITSYYMGLPKPHEVDPAKPVDEKTPIWRDIRISNVTADGCDDAGVIMGLPEMPVQNVTLENVSITAYGALRVGHTKGLKAINTHITVKGVLADEGAVTEELTPITSQP